METGLETGVLKGVSRSFYLSLRILPEAMRKPAGIAYLLARTSDTIADSAEVSASLRMGYLDLFESSLYDGNFHGEWPDGLVSGTPDFREKLLLERTDEILRAMGELGESEAKLIREVVNVIIGGQKLDLERFGDASANSPVSLKNAGELEDYAWRVAGCVGVFWTKLGYETLGARFSQEPPSQLLQRAERYGKGLQLVNILRDLPKDLEVGRCYLPIQDPADRDELMREFSKWRGIALEWVADGLAYSENLESARLRIASSLPAMIAEETLGKLDGVTFSDLQKGVKIQRCSVYRLLLEAVLHSGG